MMNLNGISFGRANIKTGLRRDLLNYIHVQYTTYYRINHSVYVDMIYTFFTSHTLRNMRVVWLVCHLQHNVMTNFNTTLFQLKYYWFAQ